MMADRTCDACGQPLVRKRYPGGKMETLAKFAQRRFCGHECRAAVMNTVKGDGHGTFGGYRRGCRCSRCSAVVCDYRRSARRSGEVPPGVRHGEGGAARNYGCTCEECQAWIADAGRRYKQKLQEQSTRTAARKGATWTGAELDLIARTDLSHKELAVMLERTWFAVRHARERLKRDPDAIRRGGFIKAIR